jgi:DNA-binding IclR family transcriptional regulator
MTMPVIALARTLANKGAAGQSVWYPRHMPSDVPAADNALRMLRHLAAQPRPVPASSVARALGLPRSTTYHLLAVLGRHGFVTHLPEERTYGLGVTAFEVGSTFLRHDPLEHLARPLLDRLVARVGTPGHLGVLHGRETLYLLELRPPRSPVLVTEVGVRLPAHLTASGRAMLAALPRAQVRALFPSSAAFVDRTGRGPTSLTALNRLLAGDRRRGYAEEDGEVTPGFVSVAAAAFDHVGRPAAAVAVTAASGTWVEPDAVAADVRATADALTRRLHGVRPT